MNPGLLNKRLSFYQKSIENDQELLTSLFTIWGAQYIKTKRRSDEQNEESYEFLVRLNKNIEPYQIIQCENTWYDVLTVDPYQKEKGYLLLKCEKSKIHNFYDSAKVIRTEWVEVDYEDKEIPVVVYNNIPCQLIKIDTANINQTQQQLDTEIKYILQLETKYILKQGDKLEITHKQDKYKAFVDDFFRNHTFQEVTIRMEGEA